MRPGVTNSILADIVALLQGAEASPYKGVSLVPTKTLRKLSAYVAPICKSCKRRKTVYLNHKWLNVCAACLKGLLDKAQIVGEEPGVSQDKPSGEGS